MARDFYEDIEMQANRITGLGNPINPNDAINKQYVDSNFTSNLVVVNVTVPYTATTTEDIILTTADVTLYVGSNQVKLISIKNVGNENIDVFPEAGETIENKVGLRIKPRNSFTLAFNGTNWNIV